MPLGEQPKVTIERQARLAQRFPVFQQTPDPHNVMAVDTYRAAQGLAPSEFSSTAMRLAAFGAQNKP